LIQYRHSIFAGSANVQNKPPVILASTSRYRRELLQRFGIEFSTVAPQVEEVVLPGEAPIAMVKRLAQYKAQAVAAEHHDALVIGSDQCAALEDEILGKPLFHTAAVQQLRRLSGKRVGFHTGICLLHRATALERVDVVSTWVQFRNLGDDEIERYLRREQPYDCAGSFRSEALGISLFMNVVSEDPTALIGLPLIMLGQWLREQGLEVP
jgi:septum formation protein